MVSEYGVVFASLAWQRPQREEEVVDRRRDALLLPAYIYL
jgi:hypothetical protein